MQEEINSIRSGIENFRTQRGINSCTPKIVCIITCKRHNRRFAIEKGNIWHIFMMAKNFLSFFLSSIFQFEL